MFSKEQVEKRRQEKYNSKIHEYKEANKKSLCIFNIFSIAITIVCLLGTLYLLKTDAGDCTNSHLRLSLWLLIGMHAINTIEGVCGLTGLAGIFCGCICVIGFFAYECAVLAYI